MDEPEILNQAVPISLETLAVLRSTSAEVMVELKGNAEHGYNIFFHAVQSSYVLAMSRPSKSARIFRKVDSAVKVITDEIKCHKFQMTIE